MSVINESRKSFYKNRIRKNKKMGINIENKIYTPTECRVIEKNIEETIMSASKKDIPELTNNFRNILNTLINFQK